MGDKQISEAAVAYSDWSQPWRFVQAISSYEHLSRSDKELVSHVWEEAVRAMHWQSSDLAVGAEAARAAVTRCFPSLSTEAIRAFVRAASYQWRECRPTSACSGRPRLSRDRS